MFCKTFFLLPKPVENDRRLQKVKELAKVDFLILVSKRRESLRVVQKSFRSEREARATLNAEIYLIKEIL